MTHKAVIRIAQVATPDLYLSDTSGPDASCGTPMRSSSHRTRSCSSTTTLTG